MKRKLLKKQLENRKTMALTLEWAQILSRLFDMLKRSLAAIEQALTAADATLHHELDQVGAKLPRVTMVLMQDGTVVMRGNCGPELLAEFGEALQKIGRAHSQSTSH